MPCSQRRGQGAWGQLFVVFDVPARSCVSICAWATGVGGDAAEHCHMPCYVGSRCVARARRERAGRQAVSPCVYVEEVLTGDVVG